MALLPLRMFLGGTFVYAGIQKLSDPGFLHNGSATYIGTQLHAFANHTPGGLLLKALALPHPEVAGVGVALAEIAIGLLAFTGLFTRAAAIGGLGLNATLFLTASWHTFPFFLGSDIVFMFAWSPFVMAGAAGQPALDNELSRWRVERVRTRRSLSDVWWGREGDVSTETSVMTRREAVLGALGATGLATLVIAGISSLAKGSYQGPKALASTGSNAATTTSPARRKLPPDAVKLGASNRLPKGKAALYGDPSTGQPDLIIRQPDGSLTAMSAVCTHAGCRVGYQGGVVRCPCHGATFNARTGAVEGGPAPAALALKNVEERGGSIYAMPG